MTKDSRKSAEELRAESVGARSIRVKAATGEYSAIIGKDLLGSAGKFISDIVPQCKVCIVSDDRVAPLYLSRLQTALEESGYEVCSFIIKNGEESKNAESYISLVNFLAQSAFCRTDILVALGGGVVGDLCGFVAATYIRGIKYVQIPTTLLAMTDSSVGGKTAIDLRAGKNLCGAYCQPSLVLCSYGTLDTLPKEIVAAGAAEVVKYGMIRDSDLFAHMAERGLSFDREYVISRSVEIKRDVVETDERDNGERQLLNFGHTVGHAVELCSGFSLYHGEAVAIGMMIVTRACAKRGICPERCPQQLEKALRALELPTETTFTAEDLRGAIENDKKRRGGSITAVTVTGIGNARLDKMTMDDFYIFTKQGLGEETA